MSGSLKDLKIYLDEYFSSIETTTEDKTSLMYAYYANNILKNLLLYLEELKPNSFSGDSKEYFSIFTDMLNKVLELPRPYTSSENKKIHQVLNRIILISRIFYPKKVGETFTFYRDCKLGEVWRDTAIAIETVCRKDGYSGTIVFEDPIHPELSGVCDLKIGVLNDDMIASEEYGALTIKKMGKYYLIEVDIEGIA